MITFHYTDKTLRTIGPVPENYNELTGDQLISLCSLFVRNEKQVIADLMAMKILIGMASTQEFKELSLHVKSELLDHIKWVFEKNGLTKQLIEEYNWLHGAASEWDNLTMAEWNACEIYYEMMITEESVEAQDLLIAVLYREPKRRYNKKKDSEGDIRVPFNANELPERVKKINRWPDAVKMAIITWFDGCREMMKERYPELFQGSATKNADKDPGMFEVIRQLSGQRYGSFKEVEHLNVHIAARELVAQIKEVNELKNRK